MWADRTFLHQQFREANDKRNKIAIKSFIIESLLNFMGYRIRKQRPYLSFFCCGGAPERFGINKEFCRAFKALSLEEQVAYYCDTIDNLMLASELDREELSILETKAARAENAKIQVYWKFFQWNLIQVQINRFSVKGNENSKFHLDLRDYLLRRAEKHGQSCFCFEAICPQQHRSLFIKFASPQAEGGLLEVLRLKINLAQILWMNRELQSIESVEQPREMKKKGKAEPFLQYPLDAGLKTFSTTGDQPGPQEERGEASEKEVSWGLEAQKSFEQMVPEYGNPQEESDSNFCLRYGSSVMTVLQHQSETQAFRVRYVAALDLEVMANGIFFLQDYQKWHPQIEDSWTSLELSSVHTDLVGMVLKGSNILTLRRRYFLCLRFIPQKGGGYLMGRSVQPHQNHSDFSSFGNIDYLLAKLQTHPSGPNTSKCRVELDLKINHQGLLDRKQQRDMTIDFLKGFQNLESFLSQEKNVARMKSRMGSRWICWQEGKAGHNCLVSESMFLEPLDSISSLREEEAFYSLDNLGKPGNGTSQALSNPPTDLSHEKCT